MSSALANRTEPRVTARFRLPLSSSTLFGGATVILLAAPLAFGAVQPWAIFLLESTASALLLAWAYRQWQNQEIKIAWQPLYAPMLAFGALIALQWITGITAYREVTYSLLLLYVCYGMLVFIATQTLRRSSQVRVLAKVVCVYGLILSSFSLLQGIAPNGKLYWIWPLEQGGLIYGPYVNHNHYAGLMEMLTPFPLVLALSRHTEGNRKLIVAGIAAVMAGTIFLSGSRGGMLAFAAEVIVLAILLRKRGDWQQPLALGVFLAVMIGFLIWLGGNELTRRLVSIQSEAHQELTGGVRFTIDRDCLRMFRHRPFLGWGLGAFPIVYPQFRSFYTSFFVNEAHNDYLQLLVETGIPGFGLAIWFLVITFRGARTKLKNWTETINGTVTVAAILGCTGILVHSFLDFNLQIPANAALFYVLCGIAAAPAFQESQRRKSRRYNLILEPGIREQDIRPSES
ncbi:MAG TPA: O-antigen ligase family protein [Terriglobales bacterium]|nr:O-antigen ligase family protein [Terriglobales bacterium]